MRRSASRSAATRRFWPRVSCTLAKPALSGAWRSSSAASAIVGSGGIGSAGSWRNRGDGGIVDRHQDPRQALDHVIGRPGPDAAGFDVGVEAGKRATKRKAGCFRRAKIEAGAGRVLVGVDRRDELVELRPPIEGQDFGVGDPAGDLEIDLDVPEHDAAIGDLDRVVLGVPGDVPAAAADGVVTLLVAQRVRHGRGQHHEARDADVVERVVARPVRALAVRVEAGHGFDRPLREGLGLLHPGHVLELRRPPAARRIAIDLGDAVLVEVDRERVGVPGRAGVAAGRVPRPPGDPHRAPQPLAVTREHARDLEERRVSGRVVADADVPAES